MRDETGSADSLTSVEETAEIINRAILIGRLQQNLNVALKELLADKNTVIVSIPNDGKYYLRKTNYRIEIRDCIGESKTWLAYVMYQDLKFDIFANRLLKKYLLLVDKSDPKYFEDIYDN